MPDEKELAAALAGEFVEPANTDNGAALVEPEVETPVEEVPLTTESLLAGLADDPNAVPTLLQHPKLGPVVQRWADKVAAAQVKTKLEQERPIIEARVRSEMQFENLDKHFSELSQGDLADELAADPKAAAAYARVQAMKEDRSTPEDPEVTARVYAAAQTVASNLKLLDKSELSDEVKATLQPELFTHLGEEGIPTWTQAIVDALVESRASKKAEASKQESQAELDPNRPPLTPGRRGPGGFDLMGTSSEVLLERGLEKLAQERRK